MKKDYVKNMTFTAVFAALICVMSPFSVQIGPIPLSLASFAVYIAGWLLGWKKGTLAVLVFVIIGAAGLPVFSGFTGGMGKITGVTGGYIIGYVPCVAIVGFGVKKFKNMLLYVTSLVLGTAVLYAIGTAWFVFTTGNGFLYALSVCVVPFLIGDIIKIIATAVLCPTIEKRISFK